MTNYTWGADGVGRGNYAGINIWCICGIPEKVILPVKDSKKTNKKQRAEIVNHINDKCIWRLGSVTSSYIDNFGISAGEATAFSKAYSLFKKNITNIYSDLGAPSFFGKLNKIKDADALIPAVSAASIFAKYALDLYWEQVHEHYPQYDFIKNAGYGVKAKEAIQKYGLLKGIHRYSYKPCKEYINGLIL